MLGGWRLNLWVGLLGTVPLMLGEWVLGLGMTRWFQWCSFALAGVVQILAGARFYRGAWGQLKAGRSNMDTLVALGSTTAFAYSTWALFSGPGGHVYFMEAAAIITLISCGHWLESRASARASSALRQLLDLAPALARRRNSDGTETEVPVAELRAGDLVVLRPGDHVPTDGEVVEGDSAVDESMLTGESVPVDKTAGSRLYAGTVNINGRLLMRVTATGEETALAHIIAAVSAPKAAAPTSSGWATASAASLCRWWSRWRWRLACAGGWRPIGPGSVHESLARFLWAAHVPEGPLAAAFIIAAGVLIIACPCAMGLATPAAIMAGSNAAAQRGILIRDGVALEKAGRVTAVLFDKTGTLTVGKAGGGRACGRGGKAEVRSPKSEKGRRAEIRRGRRRVGLGGCSGQPFGSSHQPGGGAAVIRMDQLWRIGGKSAAQGSRPRSNPTACHQLQIANRQSPIANPPAPPGLAP